MQKKIESYQAFQLALQDENGIIAICCQNSAGYDLQNMGVLQLLADEASQKARKNQILVVGDERYTAVFDANFSNAPFKYQGFGLNGLKGGADKPNLSTEQATQAMVEKIARESPDNTIYYMGLPDILDFLDYRNRNFQRTNPCVILSPDATLEGSPEKQAAWGEYIEQNICSHRNIDSNSTVIAPLLTFENSGNLGASVSVQELVLQTVKGIAKQAEAYPDEEFVYVPVSFQWGVKADQIEAANQAVQSFLISEECPANLRVADILLPITDFSDFDSQLAFASALHGKAESDGLTVFQAGMLNTQYHITSTAIGEDYIWPRVALRKHIPEDKKDVPSNAYWAEAKETHPNTLVILNQSPDGTWDNAFEELPGVW